MILKVVQGPAALASPGNLLGMQILGPTQIYRIRNWNEAQQRVVRSSPGGSNACPSLRTTDLESGT